MCYRLYRFQNGRIEQAVDIACASDDEARRVAEKIHDGRAMELWLGARKVDGWPAVSRVGSSAAHAALSAAVLGSPQASGHPMRNPALGG